MTDVRIRKARKGNADDLEALRSIKVEESLVLLARLGHSLEEIAAWQNKYCQPEYFVQHVKSPHALYIIEDLRPELSVPNIRTIGPPVVASTRGMAGLTLKDDGDDSICYFGNLYCLDHDKGYGSRLMEYRLGVADNFNIDYIQCHVHADNDKARRFVEHYGFENHGSYREKTLGSTQIIYRKDAE